MTLMTFSEAIESAGQTGKKPHVLLGNGFSIAWSPNTFRYEKLFGRADFGELGPEVRGSFEVLETSDFEVVMRALRQTAKLARVYFPADRALAERFESDASKLREVLVKAIAESHPEFPARITREQYVACRSFLARFDKIYTLNYDLLLYWALMQDEIEPKVIGDDGFRTPEVGPLEFVTWEVENTEKQRIFYLHGALHFFDAHHEIQKFTWKNTQIRLIDQVRSALEDDRYPLFVAEGTWQSKLDRIQHSGFLNRAYRSFAEIGRPIFLFGLSMGASDDHIFKLIRRGKMRPIFVSLFGDPESEANLTIRTKAQELVRDRPMARQAEVHFFDAESAKVWG